jgi:hypothetical protein
MADHTANAMLAAIRSMREVVMPALDPAHPLAREQAGLVVKYLEFWAARIDHIGDRNRAELTAYASMGRALLASAQDVSPVLASELGEELDVAQTLLSRSASDVEALRRSVAALTQLVTALVRAANAAGHPAGDRVGRIVIEHSADVALLQRAWFGPQGWEDPLPPDLQQVLVDQLAEGTPS